MKKIYIVLTDTRTAIGKLIKIHEKCKYSHVSIALDENLEQMYSMGRIKPYNPFKGGLVHEEINKGTFKRFKNAKALVFSKEIEDEKYDIIKNTIQNMYLEKEKYFFNVKGLFMVAINKRLVRENYFYCAELIKYLLDKAEIENVLPSIITPEDFKRLDNLKKVYMGYLREYPQKEKITAK